MCFIEKTFDRVSYLSIWKSEVSNINPYGVTETGWYLITLTFRGKRQIHVLSPLIFIAEKNKALKMLGL